MDKKIGELITQLRIKKNLTLEQLAFESNFSKGGLSEVERGLREIKISTLQKVCKALDISMSQFFKLYEKN